MPNQNTDLELRKRVHEALEQSDGDYGTAAQIVGVSRDEIAFAVTADEALRTRWARADKARAETPSPDPDALGARLTAEAISEEVLRECNGDITRHPDKSRGEAVNSENFKLKGGGIEGLKLGEEDFEIGTALQTFSRGEIKTVIEMGLASSARMLIKLNVEIERITKRLSFVRKQIEENPGATETRDRWVSEESRLMRQYMSVVEHLTNLKSSDEKGLLVHAMIRKNLREAEEKGKRRTGGFGKSQIGIMEAETIPAA